MPRKIPETDTPKIIESYQSGSSLREIAECYGVHGNTISLILRKHGVPRRNRGAVSAYRQDKQLVAKVLALRDEGFSYEVISAEVGPSPAVIGRVCRENGRLGTYQARGESHGGWKGGRHENAHGYLLVLMDPDHPFSEMRLCNGYVLEHRLVMAEHLGRPLKCSETVHHVNGDKKDNRINNLQLRQGRHGKHERFRCLDCGSHNVAAEPL